MEGANAKEDAKAQTLPLMKESSVVDAVVVVVCFLLFVCMYIY